MPALETPLRNTLEKKIVEARNVAEDAARAALDNLLLSSSTQRLDHLTDAEKKLRRALQIKEKQLGSRDALIRECAYENWHTMLFARFLEASQLLMHPDGVSVSMEDCAELAVEEGDPDAYATAARYAAHMLPGIFRPHDPLLQVRFAPEYRQRLEELLDSIPKPAFVADDGLGWVYQFWQTARKKQVNASGRKISGADISAVTQLFTEHYMVQFMLHNTVGAWWTARHPDLPLPTELSYLRLNDDGTPAAGSFPGWPATVKELRLLDPCCGSGHFLVAAFALLRRLRMLEEGLSEAEAAEAVLRDNLHGLELDPRCTQLAAFNLTLEAWKAGGYRPIPTPQVACSGIPVGGNVDDWLKLTDDPTARIAMKTLHAEFANAPDLGSLINPKAAIQASLGIFGEKTLEDLPAFVDALLSGETAQDPAAAIFGETVQGVVQAARLLSGSYHLTITNVPYLGRGNQGEVLKSFIEKRHVVAKADLATAFVERCRDFCTPGGSYALVTPQSWMFLVGFIKLREVLLKDQTWNWVARLGTGAFETISGEVVNVSLLTLTNQKPAKTTIFSGIDASESKNIEDKATALVQNEIVAVNQLSRLSEPEIRVSFGSYGSKKLLSEYVEYYEGLSRGDVERFDRIFSEIGWDESRWSKMVSSPKKQGSFEGRNLVIDWKQGKGDLASHPSARIQGNRVWEQKGVFVARTQSLKATIYLGEIYAQNGVGIVPLDSQNLMPIVLFCSSEDYKSDVQALSNKIIIPSATLAQVPFDLPYWQQVAAEKYPNGLPEPYSNDPTQWLFKGTILDTTEPLHVAVARLLGYRWPDQTEDGVMPDADGIVPLPGMGGERAASERLLDLLAGVYGADWNEAKLRELLESVGATSLADWLQNDWFAQHSKLFHHRPFLWHVWDGRKDGFSAIINYHMLDRARLEKLIYTYLGAWITAQKAGAAAGERGADARLAAALELQQKLQAILTGEPPYDIYVRWKKLAEQPHGWNPDLNDGVRLNIRPFVEAGVLRAKVNVKWGKDRGSDPGKRDFGEAGPQTDLERHRSNERHNDLHFTGREKGENREWYLISVGN